MVLVSSGWAASPAAIDSGESRSRHGLYALPSTGGGLIQMTIVSRLYFCMGMSDSTGNFIINVESCLSSQ